MTSDRNKNRLDSAIEKFKTGDLFRKELIEP